MENAANLFGNQCITASVDVVHHGGKYHAYDHLTGTRLNQDLKTYLSSIESAGVGEILLNSVDRDGSRSGYDVALIKFVTEVVRIPVIALGGVGRFDHFSEGVLQGGCQAVAAANIFQHMEHSTIAAKAQMRADGVPVRLSSDVKYENFQLDAIGRPF